MADPFIDAGTAIRQVAEGAMVVVIAAEDRESEGNLVMAASHITPDAVNFMVRCARGLVCLALTPERCQELRLSPMARRNDASIETEFMVSIEARDGTTTGISAHDRARTIQVASDPASSARDLVRPGHVFPLRARPGGLLESPGSTEAALDLARLAGAGPASVICEILDDRGAIARLADLDQFCRRHGLGMISVEALVAHRRRHEQLVERVASAKLPTAYGEFQIVGYREILTGQEHVALVNGAIADRSDVLTRLHTQSLIGDAFLSALGNGGGRLEDAMRQIAREGEGVLVHLARPGHGTDLLDELHAVNLPEARNLEAVSPNLMAGKPIHDRDYAVGAQILRDLGVRSVRLITSSPNEVRALERNGLPVSGKVTLTGSPHLSLATSSIDAAEETPSEDPDAWIPAFEMAV